MVHKKIKKTFLIVQNSALKSTGVQYNTGTQVLASSEQARRVTDWRREMVEQKGRQQQGTEGKLQCRSRRLLVARVPVPCWNQMHVRIFESLHLESSYVGDLLY